MPQPKPVAPPRLPGAREQAGSAGEDALLGDARPDTLRGFEGRDRLLGEGAHPEFDPEAGQVYRLFRAVLGREPKPEGVLHWGGALKEGHSLEEVASGFTRSLEFQKIYGGVDNPAFVTLLFENVLGRPPKELGMSHWTGELDSGARNRDQVVLGFSESPEFIKVTTADAMRYNRAGVQADLAEELWRLCRVTQGREPELEELRDWSHQLVEGEDYTGMVRDFARSPAFHARYEGLEDAGFVRALHRDILGHEAGQGFVDTWSAALSRRFERADLLKELIQTEELREAMAEDYAAWQRARGIDDVLDGGGDYNLLMGGMLSDCFVFEAGVAARHVVADLERGDLLRFDGFGYESAAEIRAHLQETEDGVRFADQGVRAVFSGTEMADIADDMFLY